MAGRGAQDPVSARAAPTSRPRRARVALPRWTSRTLGRPWDPPLESAKNPLLLKGPILWKKTIFLIDGAFDHEG